MADNITLNAGSGGATLATDDDGTAQHQYVKLEFGADNTQTKVDASNPLPVDLGANNDVTVTGTVTANAGTNLNTSALALDATLAAQSAKLPATLGQKTKATSLAITLASDEDTLTVDGSGVTQPISAAALPLPSGASTAANQSTGNTSLATIAGDTTSLDGKIVADSTADYDTGAGTDTVKMAGVALPASGGAVAGGTSTNPIRTDPTGTTTQPVSGTVTANAGTNLNTSALALDATLTDKTQFGKLTDGTLDLALTTFGAANVVPIGIFGADGAVIGNGGSIDSTISGTVTVTGNVTEDNSAAILSDTTSLDGKIVADSTADYDTGAGTDTVKMAGVALPASGGAVAGGTSTNPIRTDPTGTTTQPVSGTVTATATQLDIDDLNATDDIVTVTGGVGQTADVKVTLDSEAVVLGAGSAAIGKLAANSGVDIGDVDVTSQPARDRLTDNVGVALQTDAILSDTTALTPKFAVIDSATLGDNTLVAAVVGKKIRVLSYTVIAAGDVIVRFEDGASGTALSGQMNLTTNSGVSCAFSPVGHFETTANTLLNVELSASVSIDGHLTYVEV